MRDCKINIVNWKDEIVGYKSRDKIDPNKDIYQVSALWLVNSKSEILIAQRSFKKNNQPGKWGPAVAGTVEKGENYKTNIYKEAEEEIGLRELKFDIGPLGFKDNPPRRYFTQWFIAKTDKMAGEFTVQKEEVERVKWIDKKELILDIKENPDDYIPSFPQFINLLIDY